MLRLLLFGFSHVEEEEEKVKGIEKSQPCAVYLRIRFETAKLFKSKDSASTDSRFHKIKMIIRYDNMCFMFGIFFILSNLIVV